MSRFTPHVVIAGGGVAGIEAALALRDLAGDRIELTLVSPGGEVVLSPLAVAASFAIDHMDRLSLADVAGELSAGHVDGALEGVSPDEHTLVLADGARMAYDLLVVAVGACPRPAYEHGQTFLAHADQALFGGLVADLESGYGKRLAVVVPPGVGWALPAYELALLTAGDVFSMGIEDAQLTIVTPEARPLALFGIHASEAVGALLDDAGVSWEGDAYAEVPAAGRIVLRPGSRELSVDRIVALPTWKGPRVRGLPADQDGFIPVDDHGRVRGVADVFAAGDGTAFPIKQGGIACQQADAVAEAIAAHAGVPITPRPFRPVLRGHLLTGTAGPYLRNALAGGGGDSVVSQEPMWWPPTKIAGRYLGPWLAAHDRHPTRRPHVTSMPVEIELPTDHAHAAAMALDPLGPLPRSSSERTL